VATIACGPSRQMDSNFQTKPLIKTFANITTIAEFTKLCDNYLLPYDLNAWEIVSFHDKQHKIGKQWIYLKDELNNIIYIIAFIPDVETVLSYKHN
jgi:hypothetical protein